MPHVRLTGTTTNDWVSLFSINADPTAMLALVAAMKNESALNSIQLRITGDSSYGNENLERTFTILPDSVQRFDANDESTQSVPPPYSNVDFSVKSLLNDLPGDYAFNCVYTGDE